MRALILMAMFFSMTYNQLAFANTEPEHPKKDKTALPHNHKDHPHKFAQTFEHTQTNGLKKSHHKSAHETPFVLGVKGGMLFEGEETSQHTTIQPYGGGVFFLEVELNHHFELELAGGFYGTSGIVHFPVELVLKMPFHVNDQFVPFVEIGPMVSFSFHTESTESHTTTTTAEEEHVHLGAQLVTGSNIWLDPHWGLEFGLSAEMLVVQGHPHFGAGFHTGVLYRL